MLSRSIFSTSVLPVLGISIPRNMTEISRLKYVQWRPIGVCDTGAGKERKAKMFSRVDLATVTNPEVNRENWPQHPEVMKLIHRYARDVAELSKLTDDMASPEIAEVKLVGAVLGHEQTPILNQESSDGRVQFFQVSFQDGKTENISSKNWKRWLKWLLITVGVLLGMALMLLIISQLSSNSFTSTKRSVSTCSTNRQASAYSEQLRDIRKSLVAELNRLPAWSNFKEARVQCIGGRMDVDQQEQRLLQCLLAVRSRTKNMPSASRPNLNQIEDCASTLCLQGLPHLSSSCKRL